MYAKKLISLILVLCLTVSLASCGSVSDKKTDDDVNTEELQETKMAEENPITVPDDGSEDENITTPENDEENSDDPPFIQLLKSGQFYFEYSFVQVETGDVWRAGYTVAIGDKISEGIEDYSEKGFARQIWDYGLLKFYTFFDEIKEYSTYDLKGGSVYDYNKITMIGTGTEQADGEMLEYIDYIYPFSSHESTVRCYLKNGDVYIQAMLDADQNAPFFQYISNASGSPSPSLFDIPTDYTLDDTPSPSFGGRN